ncbi:MAG TPA: hypothetical protein VFE47_05235 [Tepidisphaeraceae bacterium]|jgi:hypothetical protein|nr:hypothetical protein [Tepidisphaeraceae bacterium]
MPDSPNDSEQKLLPAAADAGALETGAPIVLTAVSTPVQSLPIVAAPGSSDDANAFESSTSPQRQLSELPKDELEHLAEEFGLDRTHYKNSQDLVTAIHDRRQMIAGMDRNAMLDVVRWGRRPVTANATREQIAQEIARIKSMRFAGLSQRGLLILAQMRGIAAAEADTIPVLVKALKKNEGIFQKINRKRRGFIGSMVAGMIGRADAGADYQFLPDQSAAPGVAPARTSSLKEDIEEAGLFAGITNRLKKNADQYLNQKLDEIEARIDRKLDEIDRRLGDWRDKEIANRIRILKITLWASVIVGAASLLYSYITVVVFPNPGPPRNPPAQVAPKTPGHGGR